MNYEKGYYSNGNVQYDAAKELLTLTPTNPRSLLDIGCGSGKVSHLIYQKVSPKQMLSIDISQAMLEEVDHRYPSSPIEFRHSDIAQFSSDEVYDVIISNSSFQWFKNYYASLNTIRRCLAPNGRLIIQTPYRQIWCPEVTQLMAVFFSTKYPSLNDEFRLPCMHLESDLAYQNMFEGYGFAVENLYTKAFTYRFSATEFKQFFMSGAYKVYTHKDSYTSELPDSFEHDLLQYLDQEIKEGQVYNVTIHRLLTSLKKTIQKTIQDTHLSNK